MKNNSQECARTSNPMDQLSSAERLLLIHFRHLSSLDQQEVVRLAKGLRRMDALAR